MKGLLACLLICFSTTIHSQSKIDFTSTPTPLVLAPGFISDGFENHDMAISPAGDELFFTIQHKTFSVIMASKKNGVVWSQPEVAWFSGKFKDLEAAS